MNRRRFLGAASAASLGAIAGCMNALGTVAPPNVPTQKLEDGGWEQTNRTEQTVFEREYGPVTITGKSTTLTFEDKALAQSVKDKTLGQIDGTLAIYSASHINFSPDLNNLPAGVGREEVLERVDSAANKQFRQRMRDNGLQNVTKTGTERFQTDSGADAGLTTYSAEYPVGEMTYQTGDQSFTIDADPIKVAGDLAVWNQGDYVVVAGGAYPFENFTKTTKKELSKAITVTIDIDLGLTPQEYRSEVRSLIAATQ